MHEDSPLPRVVVRFGVFEADLRAHELRKHGLKVKLQEKPFLVLATLLEQRGDLVTRDELRRKLWPADTFVDFDNGLNAAINKLREALGDTPDASRYIETLPRLGYRFLLPVEALAPRQGESVHTSSAVSPAPVAAETGAVPVGMPTAELTALPAPRRHPRKFWGPGVLAMAGLLILLAALNVGGWRQRLLGRGVAPRIQSLAVLPLENLTGDPGQEYFVDGMTDALITDLAQISALRVISRTSVMQYKGARKPLPDIARELNVDAVVEGAVVRSGDLVRISAQLIQAPTDRHLWARNYERNLTNIVALQGEVAQAIASEIRIKLTPQEQARLASVRPVNPDAYEAYLKGRYFWNKRTEASLWKSIEFFEQAIQKDPSYAPAYASIAESYAPLTFYGGLAPKEAFPRARAAAMQALRLDESLAEAHNALAITLFNYEWDWSAAEREFRRAIELNPNYAVAHKWYEFLLEAIGRKDWTVELKRAQELDPLTWGFWPGGRYLSTGQYDRQIEESHERLERDPGSPFPYLWLARAYELKGMYEKAIEAAEQGTLVSGGMPHFKGILGYHYAIAGKTAEARKSIGELSELSKHRYVSPYHIALVYVGLGDKDRAFEWLNKAYEERTTLLVLLKIDGGVQGRLEKIRSDPRYNELERRIGLP